MGRRLLRPRRLDRGAAAVEFALILPILVLLVFGIISYGYMLSFRQAISQAAAEGARAAAVALQGADQVPNARAALNQALESYGVTCDGTALQKEGVSGSVGTCSITVAACDGAGSGVDCVTVTVSYAYDDNPLIPSPGVGIVLPDTLEYSAVARVS